MVRAWYLDDNDSPAEAPGPTECIGTGELAKCTGAKYWQINADDYQNDPLLKQIREKEGYKYDDQIEISKSGSLYEEMNKKFSTEHLHPDDESRLVVDGSGYFDVRSVDDRWIRLEIVKGDLLVLPAGIYHRFTLGKQGLCTLNRYFTEAPVWAAFNRPADDNPARQKYVEAMKSARG